MSKIFSPKLAGDWQPLFTPEKLGNYVNDHTVIRANDGSWHLIGITSFTSRPVDERKFIHAVGESLTAPMKEFNTVVDTGTLAWAPAAIEHENLYYLYYGPSPSKMAVSVDLNEWMGYEIQMIGAPPMSCHRDHMVLKINDYTWVMYVVGLYKGRSSIAALVSNDLTSWRFVQYALVSDDDAPLNPPWGAFESPYVVKYNDMYYLFTTYTDCSKDNYHNTLVFCSPSPYDFGSYGPSETRCQIVSKLFGHASEVLCDNGQYYMTTCGWRGYNTPVEGGVAIASLTWEAR